MQDIDHALTATPNTFGHHLLDDHEQPSVYVISKTTELSCMYPGMSLRPANTLEQIGAALYEERRNIATRKHPRQIPEDPDSETTKWHRRLMDQAPTTEAKGNTPKQRETESDPRCSPTHIRRFEVDGSGVALVVCLHCHLPPSQEE